MAGLDLVVSRFVVEHHLFVQRVSQQGRHRQTADGDPVATGRKSHACAGRYRCAYFRYSYFQDEYLHCAHDTLISATRTPQSGFVC